MRKILGALAAMGLAAGTAAGDIISWDGGSNPPNSNWHDRFNWSNDQVPGAGDRVVIDGATVEIEEDDVTIDSFHLIDGAELILWGVTLTLENDEHLVHQCTTPPGTCTLRDNSFFDGTDDNVHPAIIVNTDILGQVGSIIITKNDHEFHGFGVLTDEHNGAEIAIDSSLTFINSLRDSAGSSRIPAIRGAWAINGGLFHNNGRVEALGDAQFGPAFEITSTISDTSAAIWATGCAQELHFINFAPLVLEGDFEDVPAIFFPGGMFVFYDDVSTCGMYRREGCGGIDVDEENDKVFVYNGFVTESTPSCTNPGTSVTGVLECENIDVDLFIVEDDEPDVSTCTHS